MKINVLTLFPEMFSAVTESSILGRAIENEILKIELINIRDFSNNKHKKADDSPFGGGAGMVMTADPVFRALESIGAKGKKLIYMSPRGSVLDYPKVTELSGEKELIVLCGHYEGIDERILEYWEMEEISIGDYILTGGELAAMVMIDAVTRVLPNALGDSRSALEESVYSGLLEHPQYTKPREYMGMNVPEVLLNGNHEMIRLWNFEQSLLLTKERRPELFERFVKNSTELTKKEKKIVEKIART